MTRIWRWLLRLRGILTTALVLAVVGLAMLAGVVNLLSPYANRFKPDVEAWLTQRLGQSVSLASVRAEWQLRGPRVIVDGMRVGEAGDSELYVGSANFGVDLVRWLDPRRRGVSYFQLAGDDIELIRDSAGEWRLTGIGDQAGGDTAGNGLAWLLRQNSISLSARSFTVRDEPTQRALQVEDVRLSFNNLIDEFVLSGRAGNADSGELEFTIEVDVNEEPESWQRARIYLSGDELVLPLWLGGARLGGAKVIAGQSDLALRAWLEPDGPLRAFGDLTVANVVLASDETLQLGPEGELATRYQIARMTTEFDAASWQDGWQLELNRFEFERGGRSWLNGDIALVSDNYYLTVLADFLRVQDLVDLAVVSSALPQQVRALLYQLAPQAEVENLTLSNWSIDDPQRLAIDGRFSELSWLKVGHLPGVSGLAAEVSSEDGRTQAEFSAAELLLDQTPNLRWPLLLEAFKASLQLHWLPDGRWQLEAPQWSFVEDEMTVDGSFSLRENPTEAPFIDLKLGLANGSVTQAKRYWPTEKLSPRLVRWLDRALAKGQIESGEMILYGDLGDWPFAGNEGQFDAIANIRDVTLDYHPEWPVAAELNAQVRFDPYGLSGAVDTAKIAQLSVVSASAALPRFAKPELLLGIDATGEGEQMLEFLRQIPVEIGSAVDQLAIDGSGVIRVDLQQPLRRDEGPTELTGSVDLVEATITDQRWNTRFERAAGRVEFTEQGFSVDRMQATFRRHPVSLSLAGGSNVLDPANAVEAMLSGQAPTSIFVQDVPFLSPLLEGIVGNPRWTATTGLPKDPSAGSILHVQSDLRGATTTLPVPLAKPAAQLMPIKLAIPIDRPGAPWRLEVADIGHLSLRGGGDRPSGNIVLGTGAAQLDGSRGLAIEGELPAIDLDGWQQWLVDNVPMQSSTTIDSSFIHAFDLEVGQARIRGRDFSNLSIKAAPLGDHWRVALAGDQMQGSIRIPRQVNDRQLMLAEFERLDLPKPVLATETSPSTNNPAQYPPLQFIAEQMTVDDLDLGQVQIEAYPIASGMRIDTFEARSPTMQISATGDWLQGGDSQQSKVKATLTAEDLGSLLGDFGMGGTVRGGQTLARVDANWNGSPVDFDLSRIAGELNIEIGSGQIVDVEPGAGRLIGLLSLQYLPRRLAFDFRDLFDTGLTFDSLRGNFQIADGQATTDGLRIKGPTAEIKIAGRVGLQARDYNQQVTVTPRVGGALPLIGAIAQGPAGAAAGAVLQNVLQDPLGRLTEIQYQVTGPWDNPSIETTSRRQLDPPPAGSKTAPVADGDEPSTEQASVEPDSAP